MKEVVHIMPEIQSNPDIRKKAARYSAVALGLVGAVYLISPKPKKQDAPPVPSFMLDFIEQKQDQITLAWPDIGESYRVYRNHQFIYSGSAPRLTDAKLIPGTIYMYTIECLDDQDETIEKIKVQTATAVSEKRTENVLADSIFTTVVTKGQVSLEWEPIDGIEEYTIERNGKTVGKARKCSFIDLEINSHEQYTYTIRAQRPLELSEQEASEGKSVIANMVGLLKKDASTKRTAVEEFEITTRLVPLKQLLENDKKNASLTCHPRKLLRYTTFLPQKWLKNPNVASKHHYFKGDQRGFNPDAPRFRTRADVHLNMSEEAHPVELAKSVGTTKAYNWVRRFSEEGQADDDGIIVEKVFSTDEKISFQLIHSVGNPLVLSPAIDYEVNATFYRNGEIDISGNHDQAPHHEVYLKTGDSPEWETIHQARSKGLEMMAPPTANKLWRYTTFTT
jgi:hypothetical protein